MGKYYLACGSVSATTKSSNAIAPGRISSIFLCLFERKYLVIATNSVPKAIKSAPVRTAPNIARRTPKTMSANAPTLNRSITIFINFFVPFLQR